MGRGKGVPTEMVRPYVQPGTVVWDLGAHEGTFAAWAKDLGASVLAIEPGGEIQPTLQQKGVPVIQQAVSDQVGTATLYLASDSRQHSLVPWAVEATGRVGTCEVQTTTIDALGADHAIPAVIKLDLQGWESHAIRGGYWLLREYHPVLVLECWPAGLKAAGSSAMDLFEQLTELHYEVRWDDGEPVTATQVDAWTAEKDNSPQEHVNWLAVPR